jgi:hypothetical protein
MKSARVDVPNWSSCVARTLEKPDSRHNESYKPRPLLKLQGLLFGFNAAWAGVKRTRLLLTSSKMQWIGSNAGADTSEVINISPYVLTMT